MNNIMSLQSAEYGSDKKLDTQNVLRMGSFLRI